MNKIDIDNDGDDVNFDEGNDNVKTLIMIITIMERACLLLLALDRYNPAMMMLTMMLIMMVIMMMMMIMILMMMIMMIGVKILGEMTSLLWSK
jgi:hypothetical protein